MRTLLDQLSTSDLLPDGPAEVWLTQRTMIVTCRVFRDDESGGSLRIRSLNMRGAQREVTRRLRGLGFVPATRWSVEADNAAGLETMRRFRPAERV